MIPFHSNQPKLKSAVAMYLSVLFTAKQRRKGEVLPYPEIAIPLLFRNWDMHPSHAFGDGSLWDRYIWEGDVANL